MPCISHFFEKIGLVNADRKKEIDFTKVFISTVVVSAKQREPGYR